MTKIKKINKIDHSGIAPEVASEIFDQIAMFANYGFNKSHAAAYAAIGFQTGYLKTHYPESYFASSMNLEVSEVDEISAFANELKSRNIMLWAPDVNMSIETFKPVKLRKMREGRSYAISYGLSAIRGVGAQAAKDIVSERTKHGRFNTPRDFATRMGSRVNKKAALALAYAGAFDAIEPNRAQAASDITSTKSLNVSVGQLSMFDVEPEMDTSNPVAPFGNDELYDHEFDVLGHFLTGHPLENIRHSLFDNNQYFSGTIFDTGRKPPRSARMPVVVCDVEMRQTRNGDVMAIILVSDPDKTYEMIAIGDSWLDIRTLVRKKARIEVTCAIKADGPDRRFFVESAREIPQLQVSQALAA